MTTDIEAMAQAAFEAHAAVADEGDPPPWADLPHQHKEAWRTVVRGSGGLVITRGFGRDLTWRPIEYDDHDNVTEYELRPVIEHRFKLSGEARLMSKPQSSPDSALLYWSVHMKVFARHGGEGPQHEIEIRHSRGGKVGESLAPAAHKLQEELRKYVSTLSVDMGRFTMEPE